MKEVRKVAALSHFALVVPADLKSFAIFGLN